MVENAMFPHLAENISPVWVRYMSQISISQGFSRYLQLYHSKNSVCYTRYLWELQHPMTAIAEPLLQWYWRRGFRLQLPVSSSPSYSPGTKEASRETACPEQPTLPPAGAQLGGTAQRQRKNRNGHKALWKGAWGEGRTDERKEERAERK